MINWTDIKKIFEDNPTTHSPLMTALQAVYPKFMFIRGQQPGEIEHNVDKTLQNVPTYPYGVYFITTDANESAHMNYTYHENHISDNTLVTITKEKKTKIICSLTFLDRNRRDRIDDCAAIALNWFDSMDGREFCRTNHLVPKLLSPNVQDRSILNEDLYWENRVGFDVRFDTMSEVVDSIGPIKKIQITPTLDGVAQTMFEVSME